jgi:hypothetical protein
MIAGPSFSEGRLRALGMAYELDRMEPAAAGQGNVGSTGR